MDGNGETTRETVRESTGQRLRPNSTRIQQVGHSLAANHFLGIVLASQRHEGRLNDTTTQTEHQMKS